MRTAAVIVAAGRGLRAGGGVPKQWRPLAGRPMVWHAMRSFAHHPAVSRLVVVVAPEEVALVPPDPPSELVFGGATRVASVRAGLQALEGAVDWVLIHDAARPGVSPAVIDGVLAALDAAPGAAPGLPVVDALWRGDSGRVQGLMPRAGLYRAQTPQGFHLDAILAAHRDHDSEAADDVEIALAAGLEVRIVAGEERNAKVTTEADFARLERELADEMDVRTGTGYDVHRFGPGDRVMLCGVSVPHARGLQGHSDADVGMHAITDALYGALGDGDIGRHFPPSDPRWRGADSRIFLAHAAERAAGRGYRIANVDCTLVCERPKIGPHAAEMVAVLADILDLDPDRVGVKATTSERLGFTGREEGIAALATATLVRP